MSVYAGIVFYGHKEFLCYQDDRDFLCCVWFGLCGYSVVDEILQTRGILRYCCEQRRIRKASVDRYSDRIDHALVPYNKNCS